MLHEVFGWGVGVPLPLLIDARESLASVTMVGDGVYWILPLLEVVTLMDVAMPLSTLAARMSATLCRLRERTLYMSNEAWESSDNSAVGMLRLLQNTGYVEMSDDAEASNVDGAPIVIESTENGRAFTARGFPFGEVVKPADDSSPEDADRYRDAWMLLLMGGDASTDEDGVPEMYGYDLPIIHLLTCGALTNGDTTIHKTWDTPIDGETTAAFLLTGSASCTCGRVNNLSVSRQVVDEDFVRVGLDRSPLPADGV